jgi:hypothetical protein
MEGLIEEQVKQVDQVIFFVLFSFTTRKLAWSVDVNYKIELNAFWSIFLFLSTTSLTKIFFWLFFVKK